MKKNKPEQQSVSGHSELLATHAGIITRASPGSDIPAPESITDPEPATEPAPERKRGRPRKEKTGTGISSDTGNGRVVKSGYAKLLIEAREIPTAVGLGIRYYDEKASRLLYQELPLRGPAEDSTIEKLDELKGDEASAINYWRLVFSVSFYLFRDQYQILLTNQGSAYTDQIQKMNLRRMAELVGIEYYHMANLFTGQGTSRVLLRYISFLHTYKIDFIRIMFQPDLIERAYSFFLSQNNPAGPAPGQE